MTAVLSSAIPQAPGRLPLLGHALAIKKDPISFFLGLRDLGGVVQIYLGPQAAYLVTDPDLIRQVFVTEAHSFDKGKFWEKVSSIVGNGLANSSGATHLRQRRLMQPAFHRDRIAKYAETMSTYWTKRVSGWRDGQQVSVPEEMAQNALTLVTTTVFSSQLGHSAVQAMRGCFPKVQDGVMARTLNPFPFLEKLPVPANKLFNERIGRIWGATMDTITAYRAAGKDHGDLLSMLIDARDADTGESLDDEEIRDQVLTIALAAGDTTANGLAWGCYELCRHPEMADRIAEEVASVAGGRPLTFEDLGKLDYTNRFVQEVLRYYAFWMLMRRSLNDVTLGQYRIPEGSQVLISPAAVHRNSRFYPRAMAFDPDRWLPERAAGVPRNAWIPFAAGSRQCIGDRFAWAEIMLGLATICSRWKLRQIPGEVTKEVFRISLNPSALTMKLQAR